MEPAPCPVLPMNSPTRQPPTAGDGPAITLRAHPPERRRRSVLVASPSCCCCCCCCLHSIGGLAGAAVGSISPRAPWSAFAYWVALLALTMLTILAGPLYVVFEGNAPQDPLEVIGDGMGGALCLLIMLLPAVQLAASAVAGLVVAVAPGRAFGEDKGASLVAIGKITAGMIFGTLVGIGVMYLLFVSMANR